jgi:enoyl-CoA hydratase/carnithine racemase
MNDSSFVQFTIDGPIAAIILNRPEKLNALNYEMLAALEEAARTIDQESSVRVAVLTGTGEKAFCAGADIKAWSALRPIQMWSDWVRVGHRVFDQLARLRQPLICALNGIAFGGGLELALTADFRLASAHAQFAFPEVTIGTVPGWGGTRRLPALIGPARAKEMILTGKRIDAETALRWGVVNEIVPAQELTNHAYELADLIAKNAGVAVQIAKQVIDANDAGTAAAFESLAGALAATTEEGQQGVAKFLKK